MLQPYDGPIYLLFYQYHPKDLREPEKYNFPIMSPSSTLFICFAFGSLTTLGEVIGIPFMSYQTSLVALWAHSLKGPLYWAKYAYTCINIGIFGLDFHRYTLCIWGMFISWLLGNNFRVIHIHRLRFASVCS